MVKIPEERVSVLRGENNEIKKKIEEELDLDLNIKGNDIEIIDSQGVKGLQGRRIIKAIGRGFDPEIALLLAEPRMNLAIMKVTEYANTDSSIRRLKGRVIGRNGRAKKRIENMANVYLSIYGKTIGIIGKDMNLRAARAAVIRLLEGSEHSTAFKTLKEKIKSRKRL